MSYTLTTLKSAIQDYTENTETTFVSNLRSFIRSAENRLFKMIDFEVFRKNATSATTSSDPYLSVPTDFLAPFSFSITSSSSKVFLLEKDVNFIQEYNPNSSTTGEPKYYARFDIDNFIISPTPDSNYTCEIHYYYKPTSLADSTITLTVGSANSFAVDETITGATSGATGFVFGDGTSGTNVNLINVIGSFSVGEKITASDSAETRLSTILNPTLADGWS